MYLRTKYLKSHVFPLFYEVSSEYVEAFYDYLRNKIKNKKIHKFRQVKD